MGGARSRRRANSRPRTWTNRRVRTCRIWPMISAHAAADRRDHLGAAPERRWRRLRRHGEPAHPEMALGMTYLRALERAGGDPRRAAAGRHGSTSRRCSTGSTASASPAARTSTRPPTARRDRHARARPDRAEPRRVRARARARGASRAASRSSAICRGAQALNVACGGTLHQHVDGPPPDRAGDASRRTRSRSQTGSRLHRISAPARLAVNSFHHQAVDKLGDGLRVVARADDGTVEAIEGDGPFMLGVQWHAETLTPHMRAVRGAWLGRLPVPNCAIAA